MNNYFSHFKQAFKAFKKQKKITIFFLFFMYWNFKLKVGGVRVTLQTQKFLPRSLNIPNFEKKPIIETSHVSPINKSISGSFMHSLKVFKNFLFKSNTNFYCLVKRAGGGGEKLRGGQPNTRSYLRNFEFWSTSEERSFASN